MKRWTVVFRASARRDLVDIYADIAEQAGPGVAGRFIERVERYCRSFDLAPERGTVRDDIRPGIRVVGFERRLAVVLAVGPRDVSILRIFRRGVDWETAISSREAGEGDDQR